MSFDASVTHTDRLSGLLAALPDALHELSKELAEAVAERARANIEAVGAVKTGATRDSIAAREIGENEWSIGPTTDYAEFIEGGTIHMPPRPFLGPALEAVAPTIAPAGAAMIEREAS